MITSKGIKAEIAKTRTQLDNHRRALATKATEACFAIELADAVVGIARIEGRLEVLVQADQMLDSNPGMNVQVASAMMTEYVLDQGVNDDWSGRTNDVRRARYEGLRAGAREFRDFIINS